MTTNIHPYFAGVPDAQFGLAATELVERMPEFEIATARDDHQEFPPEPSTIAGLHIAYIDTEQDRIRHQTAFFTGSGTGSTFLSRYRTAVQEAQNLRDSLTGRNLDEAPLDVYGEIPVNISRAHGFRTIAGFVLFQSANGKRFYDGIYLPKATVAEAPLLLREKFVQLAIHNADSTDQGVAGKESVKSILRGDDILTSAGRLLAMLHLSPVPDIERVVASLRQQSTTGPSRAERRAADRANRRKS